MLHVSQHSVQDTEGATVGMQIASIDGVMPDEINGFAGFRFFLSLDEAVHELGDGNHLHVFAQKENRWKAGDEIELETVNADFNLNGPGEEDLPDGEGTYCYAKMKRPEGAKAGNRFNRQSKSQGKGFQKPASKGFQKPAQAAPAERQHAPAPAPTPAPVTKISIEAADVAYDRLLGESLRACSHTVEDFYGKDVEPVLRAQIVARLASVRATAIFNAFVNGRVDIQPKQSAIAQLTAGVDKDTGRGDGMGCD